MDSCRRGPAHAGRALEAEVDGYLTWLVDERDEDGRRLVVRNGHAEPRTIVTGPGPSRSGPRVNDRRVDEVTGERCGSARPSAALGPQVPEGGRGAPAHVPARHELGGLRPGLEEFFGSAAGLSASVITRLTTEWQRTGTSSPTVREDVDYVYIWADGIHFNVRLEEDRLCAW